MDHKELARMGGYAVKKKYGTSYFKELRKKRKNYPKLSKTEAILPIDSNV